MHITPEIIRTWSIPKLNKLAHAIRERIIETVAKRGGHLAPSLGVVELTIALHYVFDTPKDKLIWDVGHQCYAHKLITGRWQEFETLRTYEGIAGFPKKKESKYDVFDTGHSGNSISVALGLTTAANLLSENIKVIAIIGDGSIVTGMAFEALNNAGAGKENLIVVLNDNEMSIGKSTGAMAKYLNRLITGRMYNRLKADTWNLLGLLPKNVIGRARFTAKKIEEGLKSLIAPSMIFEELGFRYLGPFDGHDLQVLIGNLQKIKKIKGPVLVHVVTKKGKGYEPAEKEPEIYHGIGPFATKRVLNSNNHSTSTSDIFGKALIDLAEKDNRICAISAGMCLGTGLMEFKKKFPNRFFDVGICEQHAVTFAAGLALKGLRPVVAIYSTFLARAYDQIIQDIALQNLPVVFAIDRAGIVGEDGPTHHGNFDISYLRLIPNLVIAAPKDSAELVDMLNVALKHSGPFTIRYPKGNIDSKFKTESKLNEEKENAEKRRKQDADKRRLSGFKSLPICENLRPNSYLRKSASLNSGISIGKAEIIFTTSPKSSKTKNKLCILAIGSMVMPSYQALQMMVENGNQFTQPFLKKKGRAGFMNREVILVNMRFIKPLDQDLLLKLIKPGDTIVTVEENILSGGFGSSILEFLERKSLYQNNITRIGLADTFIEQGKREELLDQYGLSPLKLKQKFIETIKQLKD